MKVIDFEKRGNAFRLYLGNDSCDDYHGDDWDDAPYEHNAGKVYNKFCAGYMDFAVDLDHMVLEPAEDWHNNCNSSFCKDDMKGRKCPCLVISEYNWDTYDEYMALASDASGNTLRIYFNDDIKELKKKFKTFGVIALGDLVTDIKED